MAALGMETGACATVGYAQTWEVMHGANGGRKGRFKVKSNAENRDLSYGQWDGTTGLS